jgi:hypothetical protein
MSKFKVGDKVRILDGSTIKNYAGGWCTNMKKYVDTITTISYVCKICSGKIGYACHDTGHYIFDKRGLERCGNETIVIYRKDNDVIALDKRTGKKAIAKCSPEDTFDFNVGAKLAFERLMNGNKESITVEDMRKRLKSYCRGRSCCNCKLKYSTYRCGRGTNFMIKDNSGNYTMSNKEIKAAFNIVFGTGIKEVKRRAKVGEYVKIIDAISSYGNYKNGDILKIVDDVDYVRYGYCDGQYLHDSEYVVLEGYNPDKECKPKEPHKFKVGDIVKGNSESDDRYRITNSNMTRGKITEVSEDGKFIDVEMLEHKHGDSGNFYGLESKYFDLVEETPKLYNGKIIFTKGDGIFKTGHIYEVKDGIIHRCDGSFPTREPLKDIEDVKDYFTGKFDGNRKRKKGWSVYTLELMEVKED